MTSPSDVKRHVLDNGLVVLLKPAFSAPLISWWIFYRVGSRHEATGQTGISHMVEHLLFKGTEKFPAGMLDRAVERNGGYWNAQTSLDYTAYYATLPAQHIDLAIEAEADRMQNAIFASEDVESERTVIIAERQGSENNPMFWLSEAVQAAAFHVHPYRHSIIGDMVDIEHISRDTLYDHYRRHYVPNNAIVCAVGAFDPDEMLAKVEQHYGHLPMGATPSPIHRREPDQYGERRIDIERPGNVAFLEVGYRAPSVNDADWFAFAALDSVLGGPSGPGSGNIDYKTSRFFKGLVETGLAADAFASLSTSVDPFLYSITVVVNDGHTLDEAESALNEILHNLVISEAELNKAKKQARAAFAYATESATGQAFWLGYAEMLGGYAFFTDYVARLEAVTLEHVHTVAAKYLQRSQRTVGRFIPQGDDHDA